MIATAAEIVTFWKNAGPEKWFAKDEAFDEEFHDRFRDAHFAAAARELDDWLNNAESALALMLLLDQFPRNCFRGTGHMYATDSLARHFAHRSIAQGLDTAVDEALCVFFYMPFMHSEDLDDQEFCCRLIEIIGGPSLHHAIEHRDIIKRFGRFPHRNRILGRDTTPEEQVFLDDGGFAG